MAALALTGCDWSEDSADPPFRTSSTTTTTVAPVDDGPVLDTNTDDVEAAMRSLLEFHFWAEANPEAALGRSDEWLVPGSPAGLDLTESLEDQVERGLIAAGHPEVLEVVVERVEGAEATVLVWVRSDGYRFDGPPEEAFESPPFERTLVVNELRQGDDGQWRLFERRVAVNA